MAGHGCRHRVAAAAGGAGWGEALTAALRRAQSRIADWRANPVKFVAEEFKVEPDEWQRRVLEVFPSQQPDQIRIALQACAGPGKSAALAWCGWNFLTCYASPGEHPKGAAVSITRENLKDNLWSELAKWQSRSEFLSRAFEWNQERIAAVDHPETWFLSARSWPKTANAEEQGRTLSGLHARYILYLIDESGDIPPPVLRAAEQGLSNCAWGKIMQAGNPTSHIGTLYHAVNTQSHLWYVVRITGDPDDPLRSPRISLQWAREQIATYGRDNPWIMAYILGLFPPSSINALLGPDEVRAAMGRHLRADQYGFAAKILGVDVARFGDDRTVIFPRQGLAAFKPVIMRNARTDAIAARVAQAYDKWNADAIFVDDTGGWGAGVIDNLLLGGYAPIGINSSGKAIDPRYHNKRAEMQFEAAEYIKHHHAALPNLPELVREATAISYTFKAGKFLIQDKAEIKALLQVSPDLWDAYSLTHAQPVAPRNPFGIAGLERPRQQSLHDWDPYADR